MKQWKLVDEETGQIEKSLNAESVVMQSKKQLEAFQQLKKNERLRDGRKFVFCDNTSVEEVAWNMSLIESGAMFSIMLHLDYDSEGFIMKTKNDRITVKDLEKLLGKSKAQITRILNGLSDKGLLERVKEGRTIYIKVNSDIHWIGHKSGNNKSKVYTVVASKFTKELDLKELGLIYKIIPHFHRELMVLCGNPEELNPDKIDRLSLIELAEKINEDRKTIQKVIPQLIKKRILMKSFTGNRTYYTVNPTLLFRMGGHTEITRKLELMFEGATDIEGI